MSRSSVALCWMVSMVTRTCATVPERPLTLTDDGYGVAAATVPADAGSLKVTADELVNWSPRVSVSDQLVIEPLLPVGKSWETYSFHWPFGLMFSNVVIGFCGIEPAGDGMFSTEAGSSSVGRYVPDTNGPAVGM